MAVVNGGAAQADCRRTASLADENRDAVLRVRLEPGAYSVHLSGVGDGMGVGLIEVYEVL